MFKVYDSNFKEVKIPVDRLGFGSRALEINIGPVIYENVYSQGRRADTLVKRYAKDRQVSIVLMVSGMDETDFRMKRDALYSFLRKLGIFFVAEEQQPFKLIKVIVNDDYDIDRQTPEIAMPEIPLKIIDTPFKQSLHTTGTIGSEGMLFNNKWAYGMGTWFAENYWQYEFNGVPFNKNLISSPYDFRKPSGTSPRTLLPSGLKAGEYVISFEYTKNSVPNGIDSFLLYAGSAVIQIDPNAYIDKESKRVYGQFTINSSQASAPLLIFAGSNALQSLDNDVSFNDVKIEEGQQVTPFEIPDNTPKINVTFYNAGDEEVRLIQQKDSEIRLTVMSIPPNNLIDIDDGKTTFKIWGEFNIGDVITISGDKVLLNGKNALSDTNFNFLTVKTGWNYWDVRGVSNFDFKIDFRYLYD